MATKEVQLALHAHLSQASLATNQQELAKHLDAFSRDWKQEPTLEQFDTALGLLRDAKRSPNFETIALWWMGFLQDIALSSHIEKYSAELNDALLKAADSLAELINGPSGAVIKRALQVCASVYGTVFQICCHGNASHVNLWNEYAIRIKQLALGHFGNPSEGILLSLCKYMQTVVQIQSYSQPNTVSQDSEVLALNRVPQNHPFLNAHVLQQESDRLLRDLLSVIKRPMVTSTVVTAIINLTSALQRARPQFIPQILEMWTTFALAPPSHLTPLQVRFIDKSIRIQLLALSKMQLQPPQSQALTEALSGYGIRFSGGALSRSQQQQLLHSDKDNGDDSKRSGKRSRTGNNQEGDDLEMKRLKIEPETTGSNTPPVSAQVPPPSIPSGFGQTLLGQINITQLPLHHVVDIIFETLASNNVPHLFHSFLSTLPIMRLKDGPLPMPPPGVGPPPPGLLLQRPPPSLLPGMMPPPPGAMFPPPPHLLPPHLAGLPHMPEPTPEVKQEVKKEVNFSKLQLPRIPDNVQVSVTVLPPKRMAIRIPPRPVVVKSEAVTIAHPPRKDDSPEKDVKALPKMEIDEAQQLLKQETFQLTPFEPSTDRPGIDAMMLPSKTLLEQTFERILDSEQLISVPGATGRKMLEAVASNHQQSEQSSGEMVPFDHGGAGDQPSKVVTKGDWMTIVSRLLTRAFARDSESSSSSSNSGSTNQGMKEKMVDYICKDFKQRRELALTWLHEEWYYDEMLRREGVDMDDREPQYLWCLYKILDGITSGETQLDAKDRGLTRFLLEVPELPEGAVDVIQRYCDDSARAQIGMSCLRDIVNLRPPSRPQALKILLSYTAHPEKMQRSMAIVTAKKWYLEHPTVGPEVKEHALAQLEMLKDYPVPKRDSTTQQIAQAPSNESADIKMEGVEPTIARPPRESAEATIKTEVINEGPMSHGSIKESSMEPSGNSSALTSAEVTTTAEQAFAKAEEDIGRLLELYFSLCAKDHSLLEVLFVHYSLFDPFVQRVIRQKIQPLIKSIKSDSTKLLGLIRDFPKGAEMLVLRIIFILTDGVHPSPGLVNAVQQAVIQHDLNARFLIPIISGLDKTQIMTNLPRIVSLLKGTERERRTVTDVFLKLLTASGGPSQSFNQSSSMQTRGGPVLMPAELLIELHVMEDTVGWKAACEAMDICFNHPEIYKSEIVAVVLQRLLDLPTIPSLFMRTVIQAITLYKNLVGFVNTMVLAKLIPKQVWTRPILWKGFVRCAKMMLPTSCSVLASLPKPQLKEVMAMEPSIKEPFEAYIKEIKSSGRRVGGGAAKQVNVSNAARSGGAGNASAVVPQRPTVAEDGGDVIKKEPDLNADQTMSTAVKSEPADASTRSEGLV